jgi:hypothetical protein
MAAKQQAPADARAVLEPNTTTGLDPTERRDTQQTTEARRRRIALAAFYRAKARGFAPGGELEDWLEAEREVAELDAKDERVRAQSMGESRTSESRTSESRTSGPATESHAPEPASDAAASSAARKRAAAKRSRTTRGASIQARNRGDES